MIEDQKHFLLMAECLDDALPTEEKIGELLAHARQEFNVMSKLYLPRLFDAASGDLEEAYLLNDVLTAMNSAIARLDHRWNDPGYKPEAPQFVDFLREHVVPVFEVPDMTSVGSA